MRRKPQIQVTARQEKLKELKARPIRQLQILFKSALKPSWCIKSEREGEAENPGPEDEEEETEVSTTKQKIVLRHYNVTHMEKNGDHLLTQEADVLGIVEHKLNANQLAKWKAKFKDGFWKLTGSLADPKTKSPQAGVAVASKDFITHIENPIKTANFQKAHDEGRICKCILDVGWDSNFSVYIIYCKAGGTKAAKDYNEWLVDCCRGEMAGDEGAPS